MYFLMLPLIKLLVGSAAVNDPSALAQFPAQLGVCWAVWMVFWANAFGNKPTGFTDGVNLLLRAVLTFARAVVTFLVYYKFAAEHILLEPAIPGNLHGNALGFIDWVFCGCCSMLSASSRTGYASGRRLKPPRDHTPPPTRDHRDANSPPLSVGGGPTNFGDLKILCRRRR